MVKYAQMNRFCCDRRIQFYMYTFMYIYTETIPEEDYLILIRPFFDNFKKCQLQDQCQNIGLDLIIFVQKTMG